MENMKASEFLAKLKQLNLEDLQQIKGIGEITAQKLLEFTNSDRFSSLVSKFSSLEAQDNSLNIQLISGSSNGNSKDITTRPTVCITGTFETGRFEIKTNLEKQGYRAVDSVTKDLSYLIVGKKAGSKLSKAQKLDIQIIYDWKELPTLT